MYISLTLIYIGLLMWLVLSAFIFRGLTIKKCAYYLLIVLDAEIHREGPILILAQCVTQATASHEQLMPA